MGNVSLVQPRRPIDEEFDCLGYRPGVVDVVGVVLLLILTLSVLVANPA